MKKKIKDLSVEEYFKPTQKQEENGTVVVRMLTNKLSSWDEYIEQEVEVDEW